MRVKGKEKAIRVTGYFRECFQSQFVQVIESQNWVVEKWKNLSMNVRDFTSKRLKSLIC
jgi:hypothetical protein